CGWTHSERADLPREGKLSRRSTNFATGRQRRSRKPCWALSTRNGLHGAGKCESGRESVENRRRDASNTHGRLGSFGYQRGAAQGLDQSGIDKHPIEKDISSESRWLSFPCHCSL